MFSACKMIQRSFGNARYFSASSSIILTQRASIAGQDKPRMVVPMETPFLPDRAGRLPLNMLPQINEIASFHIRNQSIGAIFRKLEKGGLISVAKMQEITIFPEFYEHWKPNDKLQIHGILRDIGTKSFNLQFDIYDNTETIILCRNIRSIVVCDVKMKPQPVPKDALNFLTAAAHNKERYFIPQAFESKSTTVHETSMLVKPSDLDHLYHMNQANYLKFMLDAAVSGARSGAYKSLKQDIAFAFVDQIVLDYRRELRLDDVVNIKTWEDKEQQMKLCFEMSSDSSLAFKGSILLHEPLLKFSNEIQQKFPRAKEF